MKQLTVGTDGVMNYARIGNIQTVGRTADEARRNLIIIIRKRTLARIGILAAIITAATCLMVNL